MSILAENSGSNSKLEDYSGDREIDQVLDECVRTLESWNYSVIADKLDNCGEDYAVFECQDCGEEFSAPITCGLRACPSCRGRLRARFVEELEPMVENVSDFRHAVFTVPNMPLSTSVSELKKKIREIKENFGKLRRRKYVDDRVEATIYGLEVKQSGNGFNIHLHVFMALKTGFINHKKLGELWCEYFPDAVPNAQEIREHKDGDSRKALVEVVSYATKGAYFESGKAMAKWIIATKGSRLVGRTGKFYDSFGFREKEYMRCPYCGSKAVDYIGKWSELVRFSVASEPPPTINEIEGG